ncbi:MAG TPA: hypothetical protein VF335_07605, partial [Chitinivibrionales bacterium]
YPQSILFIVLSFSIVSAQHLLPDSTLTPGDILSSCDSCVCVEGYTKTLRNVPESVKKEVFAKYHISLSQAGQYVIDRLISVELGGSNDPKNLWPIRNKTKPWNSHQKEMLSKRLLQLVCSKEISLKQAQNAIAKNWIAAYKTYCEKPAAAKNK